MKTLFCSIALLFKAAPALSVLTFVLTAAHAVMPSVMAVLSAQAVNAISTEGFNSDNLYRISFIWILLLFLSNVLSSVNEVLSEILGEKTVSHINEKLIEKSAELKDLYNFENPEFHSDVHILRTQAATRPVNLVSNLMLNVKNIVILLSMLYVLGTISVFIPAILLLCVFPSIIAESKLRKAGWDTRKQNDVNERRAEYFVQMMLDGSLIKDTIHLALGDFSKKHYGENRTNVIVANQKIRKHKLLCLFPLQMLTVAGNIAVFVLTMKRIYAGEKIGVLVMFLQSFFQVQIYLSDLVVFGGYLRTILLYFDTFFSFYGLEKYNFRRHFAFKQNCKKLRKFY